MRLVHHTFRLLLALVTLFLLVCTRDHNPFADRTNALARITASSFSDGDTLEVFHRETLDVEVAVREKVDSIALRAEANRTFSEETTIVISSAAPGALAYRFVTSFYDTGWQTIELTTYREGGEAVREEWSVYVRNVLLQGFIEGTYDDTVRLSTHAVGDNDVLYHWDFGWGGTIRSPYPDTLVVIRDVGFTQQGFLWVTDVHQVFASPKVEFAFSFDDTKGPTIVCVNEGFEGRDTVLTGSSTFFFRVQITDRGKGGVYGAAIDNAAFDIVQDPLYVKVYHHMDTVAAYKVLTVRSVDNEQYANESIKHFYLGFDSTMAGGSGGARIIVLVPSRDSTVSRLRTSYLFGEVENFTDDSLVLTVSVNDSAYAADSLGAALRLQWGKSIYLGRDTNRVAVALHDLASHPVDDTTFTILYDTTAVDTLPPTIFEVTANGEPAHRYYSESTTVQLRIVAFDEGSGVSALLVNGKAATGGTQFSGYVWYATLPLVHSAAGNQVVVVARDAGGLESDTTVVIYQNTPPSVKVGASPPYPMIAGEPYRDTIIAEDGDGDTVRFEKRQGPPGLSIDSASGAISWVPSPSDVGADTIIIRLKDQVSSFPYTFYVTVVDSAFYGEEVAFAVGEKDFPPFAEADRDTVRIELKLTLASGTGPFTFRAVRRRGTSYTPVQITGGMFEWIPTLADTGYQHFVITVQDEYLRADTLFPMILVVPQNRPCSTSFAYEGDTLSDGSLDLSESAQPESLLFRIHDSDLAEVERYIVRVSYSNVHDERTIEGTDSFYVVISPSSVSPGKDTLQVVIVDRGGFSFTRKIPVYHGAAPVVERLSPGDGEMFADTFALMSWRPSDADGDALMQVFWFDTLPVLDGAGTVMSDTFKYVDHLWRGSTYHWRVEVSDGKFTTASPVWTFSVEPPGSPPVLGSPSPANEATAPDTAVVLSWKASDVDGDTLTYTYWFGTSPTPSGAGTASSDTFVAIDKLSWSTTYYWRVEAADWYFTTASPVWTFTVRPPPVPPVLGSPSPPDGDTVQDTAVVLSWQASDADGDALAYTYWLDTSPTPGGAGTASSDTFVAIDQLSWSTRYYWRVEADDGRFTTASPVWDFYIEPPPDTSATIVLNTSAGGANVANDVYDFPVLVRLNGANFDFSLAKQDGGDVRFRKADGTALAYEIERWDSSGQVAEVWVKVDTVYGLNSTQSIVMTFNNSSLSDSSDGAAVFDGGNGFVAVWHMDDNAASVTVADARGAYGALMGEMTNMHDAAGVVAGALDFDGFNDYVNCGAFPGLADMGPLTWSAWIYPRTVGEAGGRILDKGVDTLGPALAMNPVDSGVGFLVDYDNTDLARTTVASAVPLDDWTLVAVTWDATTTAANIHIYLDGQEASYGTTTDAVGMRVSDAAQQLFIGNRSASSDRTFDGFLDEVVISTTTRSSAWIKLCYENQRQGSTFPTVQ